MVFNAHGERPPFLLSCSTEHRHHPTHMETGGLLHTLGHRFLQGPGVLECNALLLCLTLYRAGTHALCREGSRDRAEFWGGVWQLSHFGLHREELCLKALMLFLERLLFCI